ARPVDVSRLAVEGEARLGEVCKYVRAHGLWKLASCAVASPRQFRFGVQCSSPPTNGPHGWAELARTCEDLGYSTQTVADHFDDRPKPQQRPRPPILVGGGGKRVLKFAARAADIVGLNVDLRRGVIDSSAGPNATDEATAEKISWIRAAAGERFRDIELHV